MQKQNKSMQIMVGGLVLIALFWLWQVEITGFRSAVELIEPVFYQVYTPPAVNAPHHRSGVVGLIELEFGDNAELAIAIFTAESHLNCGEVSGSGDYGVAQINHRAHPQYAIRDLLDCRQNIRIAGRIFRQQGGFQAWSAYKNQAYKQYLN